MADLRLQIPNEVVKSIQDKIGSDIKATDIAREAINLFNWAVEERAKGRLVLSTDENGEDRTRLVMHSLDRAASRRQS